MKIAIVGVGAMGGVYAGLFAEAGHEVWVVDRWAEHIAAIKERGLAIEGPSGDRTVTTLRPTTDLAEAGLCDLYVVATKADGVGAAAQAIASVADADALVLTIQNGLGAGERIAEHMSTKNVLIGVAEGFGASLVGPGQVAHNAMKRIRVGEMSGGSTERLERVAALWRDAGFNVQAYDDIDQLVWEKFLCNCAYSAPCALFQCTIGELLSDPAKRHLSQAIVNEGFAIGRALAVDFSFDDAAAYAIDFGERMPNARPSMLLDHMARRRSEIDAINGMIPTLGRRHGVATPVSDVVVAAVKAREAGF